MLTTPVCPVPKAAAKAVNVSTGFSSRATTVVAPAKKRNAVNGGRMVLRGRMAISLRISCQKRASGCLSLRAGDSPRFRASSHQFKALLVLFPVVLRPLSGMVAQLVHGGGVEETAVDDGVEDLLALADVGQGISVDHDEIGELAGLERPQIGVETQITRAVPGPALQCLVRRHASLGQHPELPVSAEALALAVRAQLHRNAGVVKLSGDPRDIEVIEVFLGRHHAAHRAGIELGGRDELRKPRVLPDVGVLIPVVLPPETAVSDEKCRRVTHAGLRPELEDILVNPRDRQRVLDPRVPVTTIVMLCSKRDPPSG